MKINKFFTKLINLTLIFISITTYFAGCKSTKVQEEPKPEQKIEEEIKKEVKTDDEYKRSTKEVSNVSYEEFQNDKKIILQKIEELSEIMQNYNFNEWVKYIDDGSIDYWSTSTNLTKASKRLPIKGLRLRTLQDYFKHVFIPARKNRKVEEIRYIDKSNIKAVQVKDDTDVVFYNFKKINGDWIVILPKLDN